MPALPLGGWRLLQRTWPAPARVESGAASKTESRENEKKTLHSVICLSCRKASMKCRYEIFWLFWWSLTREMKWEMKKCSMTEEKMIEEKAHLNEERRREERRIWEKKQLLEKLTLKLYSDCSVEKLKGLESRACVLLLIQSLLQKRKSRLELMSVAESLWLREGWRETSKWEKWEKKPQRRKAHLLLIFYLSDSENRS